MMNWRSPTENDYRLPPVRRPRAATRSRSFFHLGWLGALLIFSLFLNGYNLYERFNSQPKSLKDKIVGTWTLVQCDDIAANKIETTIIDGTNTGGQYIFTADGHFSFQEVSDIPRFASNGRTQSTPEENRTVVLGSIAYYGTYTVNESDNTITLHLERSSFPNQNVTDAWLVVTKLSANELKYSIPAGIEHNSRDCSYRRAK